MPPVTRLHLTIFYQESLLLAIIRDAGWPIWPLLVTSVLTLALIIERLLSLRRERILPIGLLDEVLGLVRQRQVTVENVNRLETNSPLGKVLAAGLRSRKLPRERTQESLEYAGGVAAHELGRYVGALGTIAAIAPLMGLFGTVVGMIEIFGAYSPTGSDPAQLARGISIALYNTGFGILIAIPAMVFYRYLRARIDGYVLDMEHAAWRLLDTIHGAEA